MSEEPVQVCAECGRILSGPETGQRVPNWPEDPTGAGKPRVPSHHHGHPLSHGGPCETCRQGRYAREMRERYGRGWRRKLKRLQESTDN